MKFIRDNRGFTGAEKALALAFGLAIVTLVGVLVRGGSMQASSDARRVLENGSGSASSASTRLNFGATPRAVDSTGSIGSAGTMGRPGLIAAAAPVAASGPPINPTPDWDRYNLEHAAVQQYFATVIRPGAQTEVYIPGAGRNGGAGFADVVDGNQIWEIKPARPWYMDGTGQAQLNRYVQGRPGSVPGRTYDEPFTIPYPGDPTKELVVQSYGQPGMLYYYVRQRQPDPKTVPITEPATQPEDNRVRDGVIIGGTALAGGALLWWGAKLLSPLCGPAVLVCAIGL